MPLCKHTWILDVLHSTSARQNTIFVKTDSESIVELNGSFVKFSLHRYDPLSLPFLNFMYGKKFMSKGFLRFVPGEKRFKFCNSSPEVAFTDNLTTQCQQFCQDLASSELAPSEFSFSFPNKFCVCILPHTLCQENSLPENEKWFSWKMDDFIVFYVQN